MEAVNQVKRQSTEWQKTFANYTSYRVRIQLKNPKKLNIEGKNNLKDLVRGLKRKFSKEERQMTIMWSTCLADLGNAEKISFKVPTHSSQNSHPQEYKGQ